MTAKRSVQGRRHFLRWLGAQMVVPAMSAAGFPLLGCGEPVRCLADTDLDRLEAALEAYFDGRADDVVPIGLAHARAPDAPACSTGPLPDMVASLVTARSPVDAADDLAARVRTDFEARQLVLVEGWVLSATEAAACVAVSELRRLRPAET